MSHIGRNSSCPCGSGTKYKDCCLDVRDWSALHQAGDSAIIKNLSARGKNLLFLSEMAKQLGVDENIGPARAWKDIKSALTPDAVVTIHDIVRQLWPNEVDLRRILREHRGKLSALYIGDLDPESIIHAVTRNCLHVEHFLIPDPFIYPGTLRPEVDPIHRPELYGSNTLKNAWTWFSLEPWVRAGIVTFIRLPGDYVPGLSLSMYEKEVARAQLPEFKALFSATADDAIASSPQFRQLRLSLLLSQSDRNIIRALRKEAEYANADDNALTKLIMELKDDHPYYLNAGHLHKQLHSHRGKISEMHVMSSGAGYEMARLAAIESEAFLVTNMEYKWRVIEYERAQARIDDGQWAPLSKALATVKLKYLDNVTLEAAFMLRNDNRLESMRHFMRRVWEAAVSSEPFAPDNATRLAAELDGEVRNAEKEWRKIDRDLMSGFAAQFGMTLASSIATGNPLILGCAAIAGAAQVVHSIREHSEAAKSPAGFFLRRRNSDI